MTVGAAAALILAKQLAGLAVDEMHQRAGRAIHRFVGVAGFFGGHLVQPVLHVHAGPGAFEDDMAGHRRQCRSGPPAAQLRLIPEVGPSGAGDI
jgi:hypothetical protein